MMLHTDMYANHISFKTFTALKNINNFNSLFSFNVPIWHNISYIVKIFTKSLLYILYYNIQNVDGNEISEPGVLGV